MLRKSVLRIVFCPTGRRAHAVGRMTPPPANALRCLAQVAALVVLRHKKTKHLLVAATTHITADFLHKETQLAQVWPR